MKKDLRDTKFSEMRDKTFEVIRLTERLCEFCNGVIDKKERVLRRSRFLIARTTKTC